MKRKWIAAFLTCVMVFALSVTAFAATPAATAAQKLDDLGLFQGMGNNADGTPNYGLDQTPTRAQAVTMLVRLLGKEQEAQNSTYSAPFTDVADWAKPYVNYAYKNGLTNGTSATTFGGNAAIKPTEYLTFVLRALGYTSGTDFQWNSAWTLTDKLGVTSGEYNANTTAFTRGNVASISFDALSASKKNTTTPLYQSLINAGVFTEAQAESAGLKEGNTSTTKVEATSVKLNQTSVTLEEGETVALSATVSPSNATDKSVTWSSSRTSVATVSSSGRVTAEGEGTATITAKTANGKTATCTVKVEKTVIEPTSVSVSPSRLTLKVGESDTLSASVRPTNATETWVDWESSDTRVARVSSSGRVTAVSEGTARITATTDNGRSDYCTVTVEKGEPELEFSVPKLNYNYGPMTITEYYNDGRVMGQNKVESLVFSAAGQQTSSSAKFNINIKGQSTNGYCRIKMYIYNASGQAIAEESLIEYVQANQPYNALIEKWLDIDDLEQAAKVEFYSFTGAKATEGISGGTTAEPTDPEEPEEPELTEEQKQILATAEKLAAQLEPLIDKNGTLNKSGTLYAANQKVLDSWEAFWASTPDQEKGKADMAQAVQGLKSVESQIRGLVAICEEDPHYSKVKTRAEAVVSTYETLLGHCEAVAGGTATGTTGSRQAKNTFMELVGNLGAVATEANQVLVDAGLSDQSKF